LFVLFLVILQWGILGTASLGVQHAASAAVRSAIVVLPDDPVAYEGTAPYLIPVDSTCSEGFLGKFSKLLKKMKLGSGALPEDGKCPGGPRISAIRFAAITRMIPFAPNVGSLLPASLARGIGSLGAAGWLAGAALYSYGATSVNFPMAEGSDTMRPILAFAEDKPVTVRVNYLAHCGIPIARLLMCESSFKLGVGEDSILFHTDLSKLRKRPTLVHGRKARFDQLSKGVGNHGILSALILSGERFVVLSADATLPLNSAPYSYKVKK